MVFIGTVGIYFKEFKRKLYNTIFKLKGPSVIMGDMNICILDRNRVSKECLHFLYYFGFLGYVNEPTMVNRCLDHVSVWDHKLYTFESRVEVTYITGHYGIFIVCKSIVNNQSKKQMFYNNSLLFVKSQADSRIETGKLS